MNNVQSFPIINAGYIFNKYKKNNGVPKKIVNNYIDINYPCRLDAMAINPSAVCYNSDMIFTPGEVVISINKYINVKIKLKSEQGGKLVISNFTKRKVLVKHAYLLMCDALNVNPSLEICVDDKDIPKHCGFGSSSSTITAVAVAINELYGCPITNSDLIKYLASNHGEEINDEDTEHLKVVQCIGGGATNGLTEEGVIIIAGKSTTIAKMKYEGEVLICLPNDYVQKDAKELMELEEKNLWKFKKTGDEYSEKISYNILHKVLPDMANGNIEELADLVYDYRFNMGSNENCSFVYDGLMNLSDKLKKLYEEHMCKFLALSSVGPAFFVIVNSEEQKEKCKKYMNNLDLKIIETSICNNQYIVNNKKSLEDNNFWKLETTSNSFVNRKPSKYITDVIDELIENHEIKNSVDVGCGGCRYSRYLIEKNINTISLDKYKEMIGNSKKLGVNFISASMNNLPLENDNFDLLLSIGVFHNAINNKEYIDSFKEAYRVLKKGGYMLLSVFTNECISDDLINLGDDCYEIVNRPPMVLKSPVQIIKILQDEGFNIVKEVDKHITDVGIGKRCVYTLLLKKD